MSISIFQDSPKKQSPKKRNKKKKKTDELTFEIHVKVLGDKNEKILSNKLEKVENDPNTWETKGDPESYDITKVLKEIGGEVNKISIHNLNLTIHLIIYQIGTSGQLT